MVFGSLLMKKKKIFLQSLIYCDTMGIDKRFARIKNFITWIVGAAMRKYLTQAMLSESISRLEDAARTQVEFENVVVWWDKRDKKIQDALDKKILSIAHTTFDIGLYRSGDYRMKSMFSGRNQYHEDFLNPLFCCTCQMHNLTEDIDLSRLINKATDKQKAVFFSRIIRCCTPQNIALCHSMTDRNVRDIVDRMVSKIRKSMYEVLKKRQTEGVSLILEHKAFLKLIDDEK
jgi:DNA-directed RNA polymerase specialized sigma24 family protein